MQAERDGGEAAAGQAAAALARGDLPGAARAYQRAIEARSRDPHVYNNLGVILAQRGELDAAIPLFRRAVSLGLGDGMENLTAALTSRAAAHYQADRFQEAAAEYAELAELDPRSARARTDLGAALAGLGRHVEAVEQHCRAIELDPHYGLAYANLGAALIALERAAEAAPVLERALALAPGDWKAALNLSAVEERRGNIARAEALARQVVAAMPDSAQGHNNLAMALSPQGRVEEALASARRAVALVPDHPGYRSSVLHNLNYDPDADPQAVAAEHRAFQEPFAGLAWPAARPARAPGQPLRVGYLSPDLRGHSVAYFFEPLLRAHDRRAVQVTCYADLPRPDAFTRRLQGLSDRWRSTPGLPDADLAELIRRDGIDVLVDLAGHSASNRMRLFAGRAAPVQVTYLGYPNTTGLTTMDLRITDAVADPVGEADGLHSERLVRIDGGFLCYLPQLAGEEFPPVAPPPAAGGAVTFGSFNNLAKLNSRVVSAWASLLARVPGARLLLKARGLGEEPLRQRLWSQFAEHGIERDRVELLAPAGTSFDHLATYARVDIGLDTFPYNGTTTTCEALWMGVPVVTFAGRVHASRVGASILHRVGLDDLAPASLEESLEVAARLARDHGRLAELRRSLRERILESPLMDAGRLAGQLEAAYLAAAAQAR